MCLLAVPQITVAIILIQSKEHICQFSSSSDLVGSARPNDTWLSECYLVCGFTRQVVLNKLISKRPKAKILVI